MAKRFTDSEKWKDTWFMDLPSKYKLFWLYVLDECNHSGIWKVNFKVASFYIGEHMEISEVKRVLKDRVTFLSDDYWYIDKFIKYQYNVDIQELNVNNKVHFSVVKQLNNYKEFKPLVSPLLGAKDKDKDKDKDNSKKKKSKNPIPSKYLNFCKWYYDILLENNLTKSNTKWDSKSWLDSIRLLETADGIDWDTIKNVAVTYSKIIGGEFIPQAYSVPSFRAKFIQIREAVNKYNGEKRKEIKPKGDVTYYEVVSGIGFKKDHPDYVREQKIRSDFMSDPEKWIKKHPNVEVAQIYKDWMKEKGI